MYIHMLRTELPEALLVNLVEVHNQLGKYNLNLQFLSQRCTFINFLKHFQKLLRLQRHYLKTYLKTYIGTLIPYICLFTLKT